MMAEDPIRFVTVANGDRMFSESDILDLLECIEAMGVPLDERMEQSSILDMERLVQYVM